MAYSCTAVKQSFASVPDWHFLAPLSVKEIMTSEPLILDWASRSALFIPFILVENGLNCVKIKLVVPCSAVGFEGIQSSRVCVRLSALCH